MELPRCLITLVALGSIGCTKVDVCERDWPAGRELNRSRDGEQSTNAPAGLTALPNGGALLVFRSRSRPDVWQPAELRGALLDATGLPSSGCDGDGDIRFTPADLRSADSNAAPAIAMPSSPTAPGMMAYTRFDLSERRLQIMGQQVSPSGCPDPRVPAFDVSAVAEGLQCSWCETCEPITSDEEHCVGAAAIAEVADGAYVVAWIAMRKVVATPRFEIHARVLRPTLAAPEFLPTERSRAGGPVSLDLTNDAVGVALQPLGNGWFALAWQETPSQGGMRTMLVVFDDKLRARSAPMVVHESSLDAPMETKIAMARRGTRVLLVWGERAADGRSRSWGRLVTTTSGMDLVPVPSRPEAFRLSDDDCGPETHVALTPLMHERAAYLAGWTAASCDTSGSSIRAVVLDDDGTPVFCNQACGARAFQLVSADEGDQEYVAFARARDGSLFATWTDRGLAISRANGRVDDSFSAVRGMRMSLDRLLPEDP